MTESQLTDKLTAEAAETAPAFSTELHQRIMSRIDAEPPRAAASQMPQLYWRPDAWRFPALVAAAAAVVLAVGLSRFSRPVVRPTPRPSIALQIPAAPVIPNPVRSLEDPALRRWAGSQCADVNRDATQAVAYVQRQFEVFPTQR